MSKWVKNPDEIVLENLKMFHLESMDSNYTHAEQLATVEIDFDWEDEE